MTTHDVLAFVQEFREDYHITKLRAMELLGCTYAKITEYVSDGKLKAYPSKTTGKTYRLSYFEVVELKKSL